jgi:hypothetical protein
MEEDKIFKKKYYSNGCKNADRFNCKMSLKNGFPESLFLLISKASRLLNL